MTTIDELKSEKKLLLKERNDILLKQSEDIKLIKENTSVGLDLNAKKLNILNNQIKSIRKPDIAKTVRQVKRSMNL